MTTQLQTTRTELPDRQEVDRKLAELAMADNPEALNEIAGQAAAYQEYERRNNAKARADEFGRVKVLAEAHIGWIDLQKNPQPHDGPLKFGAEEVTGHLRSKWRMLGSGLQTGHLTTILNDLTQARTHDVTTDILYKCLIDSGLGWFQSQPLRAAYERLHEKDKVTHADIANRSGVPLRLTQRYLGPHCERVRHGYGLRLALALGIDPNTLKPVPPHLRRKQSPIKRRPHRARPLRGGRLDETYSLVRKALQEFDRAIEDSGGQHWGTDGAWEHLYAAEDIIGKALRRAR